MKGANDYPLTQRTWLLAKLDGGASGEAEARSFLMEVYVEPLRAAAQQRFRMSAEQALDLVHGFFASRLSRPDYLSSWDASDKRLRDWLVTGLGYFYRETRRATRRAHAEAIGDQPDPSAPDPIIDVDRSFVHSLVRAAMRRAEMACVADELATHWALFEAWANGERLHDIAIRLGITDSQAQVRRRAPWRRFVMALKDLLVAVGVAPAEIPRAIDELLSATAC